MANYYWVGSGGKTWDTANNWSATPGGAGGAGVPGTGDTAYFTADDTDNCKVDLTLTIGAINAVAGYTGTLDINNNDVTIEGDFDFAGGGLTLGVGGTITCQGNWDTSGMGGEFTEETATVVMSGTTKTLTTRQAQDFYHLTISGTITEGTTSMGVDCRGTLTISGTYTTTASSYTIIWDASDFTGGTIQGSGELRVYEGATLSAAGTISIPTAFYPEGQNMTIPARTYGSNVFVRKTYGNANVTATLGTAGSQSITISGNLEIRNYDNDYKLTVEGATYDPTMTVNGYLYIYADGTGDAELQAGDGSWDISGKVDFTGTGGGTEYLLGNAGTLNVAGDIDLTGGTLTAGTSEFILDGAAAQTITSDSESFYNLTITNTTASPGVTFADSCAATNMLKCITSDVTLTFTNGITGTFADVNLDGQDANYVTIRPSAGATYSWAVAAASQTDVSYVSVSYCDATGGETIDASNGTNDDGGNNDGWTFVVSGQTMPLISSDGIHSAIFDGLVVRG